MIKTKSRLTRRQFVLASSAAAAMPLMMNGVSTAGSENPVGKVADSENYPAWPHPRCKAALRDRLQN
jgi:hypothetical protein